MTKAKKPRKSKVPEAHWRDLIACYLQFMQGKFNEQVAFDNYSHPRDLKSIVRLLYGKADEMNVEWTKEIACRTLNFFLTFAFRHEGVITNIRWFLPFANRLKDEILEEIHLYKLSKQNHAK